MEVLRVENLKLLRRSSRRGGMDLAEDDVASSDGIGFTIDRGESVALVGESREALHSLALALLGCEPVAGGTILLAETPVTGLPERRLRPLRRHLQAVFSEHHKPLPQGLTVRESFREVLAIWHPRATREERAKRVERVMIACGLPEAVQDLYPAELDAAERQQVALARALLPEPHLLLCDQFVEGLDAVQRAELLQVLRRVRQEFSLALLILTEDFAVASLLAEEVGVIHRGRVVERGRAADLVSAPTHDRTRRLVACAA